MRLISVLNILFSIFFLSACSLYQSDGRKAIEKNSAGIVTLQGYDSVQNIKFSCYQSGSAPYEMKGPIQVIDNEFEELGYSVYLINEALAKKLLVYQVPSDQTAHNFCNLDTFDDLSKVKIHSAVRLGVQLLSE